MMRKLKFGLVLFFLITPFHAIQAMEIHPVASIGYDFGGDTLTSYTIVKVNNRPVNRTGKISAGNGIVFSGGVYIPLIESLGVQITGGLKIDSETFVNDYLAFSRIPIDLLAIGHLGEHHNIGLGLTYHTNTSFTWENTTSGTSSVSFDNAIGGIAEYNYSIGSGNEGGMRVGLRYTNIKYTPTGFSSQYNGSSLGLILYIY